jgi:general secretion pathway protein H
MVVIAIMAFATLGVMLVLPDPDRSDLEKEATRLAALLDTARAYSRATGLPVVWRTTETGFQFDGLPESAAKTLAAQSHWLNPTIVSTTPEALLGPEPIIAAQQVDLVLGSLQVSIATDGLQPFTLKTGAAPPASGATP